MRVILSRLPQFLRQAYSEENGLGSSRRLHAGAALVESAYGYSGSLPRLTMFMEGHRHIR